VKLPSSSVVVSHRSDGSGTTGIFTEYLSAVSPEWKQKVGSGTAVSWPVGIGGKGNEGVTGNVRNTPAPSATSSWPTRSRTTCLRRGFKPGWAVCAALTSRHDSGHRRIQRTAHTGPARAHRQPAGQGADAYPISGLTFLIIPKDGPDKAKRTALKQFVQYIITNGQAAAESLNYAPLPDEVKQYDQQQLQQLTAGGSRSARDKLVQGRRDSSVAPLRVPQKRYANPSERRGKTHPPHLY